MMCNMCMYCQRLENDGVPKDGAKFLNFGIFANLPHFFSNKLATLNLPFCERTFKIDLLLTFNFIFELLAV